jgi:serine-type D-Ala-D-Ala carboxypeptidase/endopeptidase
MLSDLLDRRTFFVGAMLAPWAAAAAEPFLSGNAVSALLASSMAEARAYPCNAMVAGLCDTRGRQIIAQGSADNGGMLNGDTVFDIGSISKLFTALALADMVARGQMAMQDPLGKYLPAGVRVPEFGGKPITLLDLATYSPGLPGWPADMPALSEKPFRCRGSSWRRRRAPNMSIPISAMACWALPWPVTPGWISNP